MPKVGKNIYKRQDRRWEGRYHKKRDASGKIIYGYVYGKTCAEVKQKLAAATDEETATTQKIVVRGKQNITFTDAANRWLSVVSLQVKPSTYAIYTATLELHILPKLGKRRIQTLTAVDISRFARDKLENGRADSKGGLSAKSVRDMLSVIKSILDFACTEKIINNRFTITYPKHQQKTMRVLSRQEQSSLEALLTTDMDIYKLGIRIN